MGNSVWVPFTGVSGKVSVWVGDPCRGFLWISLGVSICGDLCEGPCRGFLCVWVPVCKNPSLFVLRWEWYACLSVWVGGGYLFAASDSSVSSYTHV